MPNNNEDKIVVKGLQSPGPLLIVKKKLPEIKRNRLRIIVSHNDAADDLVEYFTDNGAEVEVDRAGDDYHIVVDLTNFEDRDR